MILTVYEACRVVLGYPWNSQSLSLMVSKFDSNTPRALKLFHYFYAACRFLHEKDSCHTFVRNYLTTCDFPLC